MKDLAGAATISVPVVNEVTNNGIVTALELDNAVLLGMTYGAWFKVGMFIALVLLIAERTLSIRNKLRE